MRKMMEMREKDYGGNKRVQGVCQELERDERESYRENEKDERRIKMRK